MKAWAIISLVILIGTNPTIGQNPDTLWLKTYYVDGAANEVELMPDGCYVFTGSKWLAPGVQVAVLCRTNSQGDSLWLHTYQNFSVGYELEVLPDSSIAMCGYLNNDAYLVWVAAGGDIIGTYTYPATYHSYAYTLDQTSDGGLVLGGMTTSGGGAPDQMYLVKIDSNANFEWSKEYGGPWEQTCGDVQQLQDNGYLLLGSSDPGNGYKDVYVVRTDSLGDTLWTRTYGDPAGNDFGEDFLPTADGGFLIMATTYSLGPGEYNPYLIRINASGDTLWTRVYGGGGWNALYSLIETADGGYIGCGAINDRIWVVKFNQLGDTLWTSTYDIGTNEFASSIRELPDGTYILSGGVKLGPSASPYYAFLLKLGTLTGISDEGISVPKQFELLQNYPNPFNPSTKISWQSPISSWQTLKVYDVLGRKVKMLIDEYKVAGSYTVQWDGTNDAGQPVSSGVYLYQLKTGKYIAVRKMLLLR